jgi:sodium-dependent phosphate transporter
MTPLASKENPPLWIIFFCAFSLVFGLAMFGQNVTYSMGRRLAKLSPSRGFAAELATSCVIMIAAQNGLPTATSQCLVGGVVGVGLAENWRCVNWSFFGKTFTSWIITLPVCGLATAAMFMQGYAAPH